MRRRVGSEWDKAAKAWDVQVADQGMWYQRNVIDPVVLNMTGPVRGRRILEIGCGNGYLSRLLAAKGAKVVGTSAGSSGDT